MNKSTSVCLTFEPLVCLTFDPLPPVQVDLPGALGCVRPRGDKGASGDSAVEPPLHHLGGRGWGGRGRGLNWDHGPSPRTTDRQVGGQTGSRQVDRQVDTDR